MNETPGKTLRAVRERLQVAMRDVESASAVIAQEESNREFYIAISRLSQIECDLEGAPSVFKLYTLCSIYGLDLYDVLKMYGIDADRCHSYQTRFFPEATRPVSSEIHGLAQRVTVPARIDGSFRWSTTHLLNDVVELWGEVPAAFLIGANPRQHMYGYVGDRTMVPLIQPGSLVMIDSEKREVQRGGWKNEFERPIYFIEFRTGYRCAWCQVDGTRLTLIPHVDSGLRVESFSLGELDVLGQVVWVAMKLPSTSASTADLLSTSPKPGKPAS